MHFGSDNQTGASNRVMEMLTLVNTGFTHGYGDDHWTERAVGRLRELFECDLDAFFVSTGTAANTLALSCLVQPWEVVLCHVQSHIISDESTAPEFFTGGARLVGLAQGEGKIRVEHLEKYFHGEAPHVPHNPLAKALSLTQATELGLLYTVEEIQALTTLARQHNLYTHMDGARFANAVQTLECTPAEITWKAGIDVLCLGATKCGCLAAEAVIFFNRHIAEQFIHRRKRSGHLLSKGRYFGAQFLGWLQDNHWLDLAREANFQASCLEERLSSLSGVSMVWPRQSNEIFVIMPRQMADHLRAAGADFYDWPEEALPQEIHLDSSEVFVRLVTSFATKENQVDEFCKIARSVKVS